MNPADQKRARELLNKGLKQIESYFYDQTDCRECAHYDASNGGCGIYQAQVPEPNLGDYCEKFASRQNQLDASIFHSAIEVLDRIKPTTDCRECAHFKPTEGVCLWWSQKDKPAVVPPDRLGDDCEVFQAWGDILEG